MLSRRSGVDTIDRRVRSAVATLVVAASATALTSAPAWSWGSINNFVNAHRCIDETAYNFVQLDPAFGAAAFPSVDEVDANEGISLPITSPVDWEAARRDGYERHAYGPGPDSVGATFDSWHYYNPRTGMGNAPRAAGLFFEQLVRRQDAAKSAAWAAHFLADVAVPYHVNGMFASDLMTQVGARRQQLAPPDSQFLLDEGVTGPRWILSAPYPDPALGVPGISSRGGSADFVREVRRFFADGGGAGFHDWFDPWYWNGTWPAATGLSSHLVWEGQVPNCLVEGLFQVERYSQLWPGNPEPTFEDPIERMRQAVEVFATENAHDTEADLEHYERSSTDGLLKATASVATMWRASFSALHVDLTYEIDPKSLSFDSPAPQVVVRGKVGNFSDQIAGDVQVRLTVSDENACKIVEGDATQSNNATPPGYHAVGVWRLEGLESNACEVKAAVIGAFTTPDLQYAETKRKIEIGAKKQPPPKLYIGLSPNPPAPNATVEAEAVLAPPPARSAALEYEWACDGCKLVAQNRARATIQAPASGQATVKARARIGQSHLLLAEGEQTFVVKAPPETDRRDKQNAGPTDAQGVSPGPPILAPTTSAVPEQPPVAPPTPSVAPVKPPVTQPTTATMTTPTPTANAEGASTPTKNLTPSQVQPFEGSMDDWAAAMKARDRNREVANVANASADVKARASQLVLEAEKRMQAFWNRARANIDGLPAFVERDIGERERIYGQFHANPPQDLGDCGSNCVSDLEGRDPNWRYQCFIQLEKDHAFLSARLRAFLDKAKATEALLAKPYDGDGGFAAAMQAYDALWETPTDANDQAQANATWANGQQGWQGQTRIDQDWRAKGLDTAMRYPCDDDSKPVALKATPPGPTTSTLPPSTTNASLSVTLALDPAKSSAADVAVVANAAGGAPPYRYQWAGAQSDSGNRAVYAAPKSAAEQASASVKVTDAAGAVASATLPLAPPKITLNLTKTSPASNQIRVGETVKFAVELKADGKAIDPAGYTLRWEPNTQAHFAQAEGPGVNANSATFSRLGKVKVWVVALAKSGGALATVGESQQIELEVSGVDIALTLAPPEPLIGQETRITAKEAPTISDDDAAYWWECSGAALQPGPEADPRVYSLIPKDGKPITVTAHLKEKLHGDELGAKSLTFSARGYRVTIVNVGPAWENSTQRPVIWRQGLVVLDKQIVAGQDARFRVDISPDATATPLRYRWSAGPGTTISGNDATRETRAQRPDLGDIVVNVEVRDARDVVLGVASASVAVTVSADELAEGKAKAEALARLKAEATAAWADGDLDAACDKGKAAAAIDPGFTATATGYCDNRGRILALAADANGALAKPDVDKPEIDKAQNDYDQARAINAKAKPLADLAHKIADARTALDKAAALIGEADQAWRIGDAETAAQKARDALAATPKSPAAQQAVKRYADALTALQAARAKAKAALDRGDADGALAAVAEGKKTLGNDKPLLQLEQAALKAKADENQCRQTASDGLAKQQAGDASGALVLYRQALAACPQLCAALANSAAAYDATGDKAAAKQAAAKALSCDPSDKDVRSIAARHGVAPPPPADMRDPSPYCHELMDAAVTLHRGGDPKAAIPLYQQTLALCPKVCIAMNDLGVALERTGDAANGKSYLAAALACDPTNKTIQTATAEYGVSTPAPSVTSEPLPPSTPGVGTWTYFAIDDCAGHDVGRSDGAAPSPEMCRQGVDTAVCWDGKSYVNKGKAGAWCTYKNIRAETCDEHAPNPARMYACSPAAVGPASNTPEPSKSPEARKACEALLAQAKQSVAQNDRQGLAGIDAKLRGVCPPECLSALAVAAGQPRPACLDDYKAVIGFVSAKPPTPSTTSPTPQAIVPTPKTDDKSCDDLLNAAHQRWAQNDGPGAVALYKRGVALCPLRCDLMNELSGLSHALGDAAASQTLFDATKACGEGKKTVIDQTPTPTPTPTAKGNQAPTQQCKDMDFDAAMRWTAQDRNGSIDEEKKVVALCPGFCEAIKTLSWSYHLIGDETESQRWSKAEAQCRGQNAPPTPASTTPSPKPTTDGKTMKDGADACDKADQAANAKALQSDYQGAIDALKPTIGKCGARDCAAMHQIGVWFYTIDKPDEAKRWLDDGHKCDPSVSANIGSFNAGPQSAPTATPSPSPKPSPAATAKPAPTPTPSASPIAPPTPRPSDSGAKSCQDVITLGVETEKKGDLAGAADLLNKAIGLCPQRCDAMDELVSILRKSGDAAGAQAMTKRSRSCWDNL